MAENVMKRISLTLLLLPMLSFTAWGDALPDPTRPPAGIDDSYSTTNNISVPAAKGLQSVIISPTRCAAIMDGKTVELGGKHDNTTLIEVGEFGVVMLRKDGVRKLIRLFPAVGLKITEALPLDKQSLTCRYDQNGVMIKPPGMFGMKEKK